MARSHCQPRPVGRSTTRAPASRSSSFLPTCRSRAPAGRRRSRWWTRSSTAQAAELQGRQVRRSATSPATTRPPRPASGTRASARRTRNAYAQNKTVVGVIGTFNSGCAEIIDPDPEPRGERPGGHGQPREHVRGPDPRGPGTAAGEPDKYYPTGKRNYIRIVAADDFQGAADALLDAAARLQERLHPQRQGGLRPRRRDRLQERRHEARPQGRRLHRLGPEGVELRGARDKDQAVGRGRRLPRRPRSARTARS